MKAKSLIKIGLSVAMLLLIFNTIDSEKFKKTLQGLPLGTVTAIVLLYVAGQLVSSVKWWRIVRAGGISVSYLTALKAYFIGMFVNCFGLGMIGGDVARGVLVAAGLPKKTEGIASVIVDRIHGLTVLSCIALFTSFLLGRGSVELYLVQALAALCAGFFVAWLLGPYLLTHLPFIKHSRLAGKLNDVAKMVPREPKTILIVTLISALFHTLQISMHALMAYGVGAAIPWQTLFVVIPFVNIASSLPISWNGLGVRENSYIFFLSPALLTNEQALAFGAIWILAVTISSAIGGIVALMTGNLKMLKSNQRMLTSANDDLVTTAKRANGSTL